MLLKVTVCVISCSNGRISARRIMWVGLVISTLAVNTQEIFFPPLYGFWKSHSMLIKDFIVSVTAV